MNIKAFPIWGQVWNFIITHSQSLLDSTVSLSFSIINSMKSICWSKSKFSKFKKISKTKENTGKKLFKEIIERPENTQRKWNCKGQERLTWQFVSRTQCSFSFSWFIFHLLVVGGVDHWEASFWFCSVFWEFWFSLQQWFSLEDSSLVVSVTQISLKKQ